MKSWSIIFLIFATFLLAATAMIVACSNMDNKDPSSSDGDDDDGPPNPGSWQCDISEEGMEPLQYYANCFDPTGAGNVATVTDVLGTSLDMANGERYSVKGLFDFPKISSGKVELIIGCPTGSDYKKCSWPFIEQSGAFETRLQVQNCDIIYKPTEITLSVWDAGSNFNTQICLIYLGADVPVDDDTVDDDTTDDDTTDDDTTDDDTIDDDTTDDDTVDDDTIDDDVIDDDATDDDTTE